jgi:ketosteroid isomerase-like protein
MRKRTLSIGGAVGLLILSLAACGGSGTGSDARKLAERQADLYAIDQIEKTWHRATSTQDVDLMMILWSPNATFTPKPGVTLVGKKQIRSFWLKAPVFQPKNHWVSETPAYKIRITVNGDKGTLYFECHYVDPKTQKVVQSAERMSRLRGSTAIGLSPITWERPHC